jgi:hypothetical protein
MDQLKLFITTRKGKEVRRGVNSLSKTNNIKYLLQRLAGLGWPVAEVKKAVWRVDRTVWIFFQGAV